VTVVRGLVLLLSLGLVLPVGSAAESARRIPLAELGDLSLAFATLEAQEEVPGPAVWGEVSHRPGAGVTLYAPRRLGQLEYLVDNGQAVAAGEPVAVMRGPEIHHWQLSFTLLGERYRLARQRYERNLPLYRNKTLPEGQWQDILVRWQELELEYEHMQHFGELVESGPEGEADSLLLKAPVAGLVTYPDRDRPPAEGEVIASCLPREALRLKALVPVAGRERLLAFAVAGERFPISARSARVLGYMVEVWSAPLPVDSTLLLGESVSVTPLYRPGAAAPARVFRVPASALLAWGEGSHLLVRDGDHLRLQAVTPLGSMAGDILVQADATLAGARVLVTSVSAVQGVLLGLGND
jgi:hypothetical protein